MRSHPGAQATPRTGISIQRCRGCSSSTARRPCPRRSVGPSSRSGPALSGPQGAQHYGTVTQIAACFGPACVARQAWELDDADKAEKLIRNLAQRLERDWSGVSGSILEGIDEILTVTRLGLPKELRRSLACTNIVENMMATVRRVCRNVKRWRSASMALRWTAAAMQEAAKGFRRLKAHKQLAMLRKALLERQAKLASNNHLAQSAEAA
jgi:Transposase, Mutator family